MSKLLEVEWSDGQQRSDLPRRHYEPCTLGILEGRLSEPNLRRSVHKSIWPDQSQYIQRAPKMLGDAFG